MNRTRTFGAALAALVLGAAAVQPAAAQAVYSTESQQWGKSGTRYTTTGSDGSVGTMTVFKDDNGNWRSSSSYQPAPTNTWSGLGSAKSYTGMGGGYHPLGH